MRSGVAASPSRLGLALCSFPFYSPSPPARPFSLPFWPASRAQLPNRNATLRHSSRAFDVDWIRRIELSIALSATPSTSRTPSPSLSFFLVSPFCCILSSLRARFFDSPSISPRSFSLCVSLTHCPRMSPAPLAALCFSLRLFIALLHSPRTSACSYPPLRIRRCASLELQSHMATVSSHRFTESRQLSFKNLQSQIRLTLR